MKTRLQLAEGLAKGTLTPEEKEAATSNPLVVAEAKRIGLAPAQQPGRRKAINVR